MANLVVDLAAVVDEDADPPRLWWNAEWGPEGWTSGTQSSSTDLGELVSVIVGSVRPGQTIEWTVDDDEDVGGFGAATVAEAVAQTGVTLPRSA